MKLSFPEFLTLINLILSLLTLIDFCDAEDLYINNKYPFQFYRYFTNLLYFGSFDLYHIFLLLFNYKIYIRVFKCGFNEKSFEFFYFFLIYSVFLNLSGIYFNSFHNYNQFIFGITYFWGKVENDNNVQFLLTFIPAQYFYLLFN